MGKISSSVSVDECIQLGNKYFGEGKKQKAIKYYLQATKLDPQLALAWCNAGVACYEDGDLPQAEKYLRKAILLDQGYSLAHYNLAMVLYRTQREDEAIPFFESVIDLEPSMVGAYNDLGLCLKKQRKLDAAQTIFERALAIDPTASLLHNNLGNVLREQGKFMEAREKYLVAVSLNPEYAEAWGNLGGVDKIAKYPEEGRTALHKAIGLKPDVADFYHNFGVIDQDQGRIGEAISNFEKALELNPSLEASYSCLYLAKRQVCDWSNLPVLEQQLDAIGDEDPFTTIMRSEDLHTNYEVAKRRSKKVSETVGNTIFEFSHRKKKKKIRLGYFSNDLRDHPIGQMVAPLFGMHDRNTFEVYIYSYGVDDGSNYRRQAQSESDYFLDVHHLSNPAVADRIFTDEIDILIDLTGYTMDNRLEVCAMRPAPVQVTYLGYPGTTGAEFFDAVVLDKHLVLPGEEKWFSEKVMRMPHCYQINNKHVVPSPKKYSRKACGLPADAFVFASFNQAYKIEPHLFDCWMRILSRVPKGVLWFWKQDSEAEMNLKKEAKKRGIDSNRLVFGERLPKADHLARMSLADLSLDTLTYGGHTTTTDNLMAGVPVITVYGTHIASRVCASILREVGLDELIVPSVKEYEDLAVKLATHPEKITAYRKKITRNKLEKTILNTERTVRSLEALYSTAWNEYTNHKGTS